MLRHKMLAVLTSLFLPVSAQAQGLTECHFGFDIDTQSSAFQSMIVDGETKRGFWLSINRAPSDVRAIARFIGRLQVCLRTTDGKPRTIVRDGREIRLDSPFVTNCTASLLPGNRLLTNAHCFYDPELARLGFTVVDQVRVNFNYTSKDDVGAVTTYLVSPREVALAEDLDTMVLQIISSDANADQGGHIPMVMSTALEPFQELRMIHHPAAEPQQYSAGTCQIHRRQSEIAADRSPFRHTCESIGGSSGALLFDARTLRVVALHNQGGLSQTGDSFNGGHKIGPIEAALNLGFTEPPSGPVAPPPDTGAQEALVAALLLTDPRARIDALRAIIRDHPGSRTAEQAATVLATLRTALPPPPTPGPEPVTPEPPAPTSLVARMLADPDVQTCDRISGAPTTPTAPAAPWSRPERPTAPSTAPPPSAPAAPRWPSSPTTRACCPFWAMRCSARTSSAKASPCSAVPPNWATPPGRPAWASPITTGSASGNPMPRRCRGCSGPRRRTIPAPGSPWASTTRTAGARPGPSSARQSISAAPMPPATRWGPACWGGCTNTAGACPGTRTAPPTCISWP